MNDDFTKKIVKLKNKRVAIGRGEKTKDILLHFTRLRENDDSEVTYSHSKIIGKKVDTKLVISKAAAVTLFFLLKAELTISDIIEFEKESGNKVL